MPRTPIRERSGTCVLNRDGRSGAWQTGVGRFGVTPSKGQTPNLSFLEAESCKKMSTDIFIILLYIGREGCVGRGASTFALPLVGLAFSSILPRRRSNHLSPLGVLGGSVSGQATFPPWTLAPFGAGVLPFRRCVRDLLRRAGVSAWDCFRRSSDLLHLKRLERVRGEIET